MNGGDVEEDHKGPRVYVSENNFANCLTSIPIVGNKSETHECNQQGSLYKVC